MEAVLPILFCKSIIGEGFKTVLLRWSLLYFLLIVGGICKSFTRSVFLLFLLLLSFFLFFLFLLHLSLTPFLLLSLILASLKKHRRITFICTILMCFLSGIVQMPATHPFKILQDLHKPHTSLWLSKNLSMLLI